MRVRLGNDNNSSSTGIVRVLCLCVSVTVLAFVAALDVSLEQQMLKCVSVVDRSFRWLLLHRVQHLALQEE
jgi:hypothetical protein